MYKIKVGDNILSIDVDEADGGEWKKLIMLKEDPVLRARIAELRGFRGLRIGNGLMCPLDLRIGLRNAKIPFEILEDVELVEREYPEGIIW